MDCVDGLSGIEWLRHFFPSVWDLMDFVGGWKGKSGLRRFFPISVGFDGLCSIARGGFRAYTCIR